MLIRCHLVIENGQVIYPTPKSEWAYAYDYKNTLVGEYTGGLYSEEDVKAFDWVEFDPDKVIDYGTKVTKLAFLTRLGDDVLGAIEATSRLNNPSGYAAAIIKIKHASSTYIDLALPETIADVQKLVTYGFIDQAKCNHVLYSEVTEKEVPLLP